MLERAILYLVDPADAELVQSAKRKCDVHPTDIEQAGAAIQPEGVDLILCLNGIAGCSQMQAAQETFETDDIGDGKADEALRRLLQANQDIALDLIECQLLFGVAVYSHGFLTVDTTRISGSLPLEGERSILDLVR